MASFEPEGASPYNLTPHECHEDDLKIIKARVTKEQAIKTVRRWWRSWLMAWGLRWHGRITQCRFMYVPFWAVKARVSGIVYGEQAIETESTSATMYTKNSIDGNLIWSGIACDSRDVGIGYLWNLAGNITHYDTYAAYAKETTVSKEEGLEQSIVAIKERAIELTGRVDRVLSTTIEVVPLKMDKIIYPLWVVDYCYGENNYRATIDGVTGDMLAGRAPGNGLIKCFSTIFGVLLILLGIALFIMGGRVNDDGLCCLAWIAAAICPVIAYEAFQYGQCGGIIVAGQVRDGYRPFRYFKEHYQVMKDGDVKIKRWHTTVHH